MANIRISQNKVGNEKIILYPDLIYAEYFI